MLNIIRKLVKKPKSDISESKTKEITEGWHQPLPAAELLNTPLRQQYLSTIWQNVSMTPEMFKTFYREPIEKYAEMVQLLPASESHHHSHIGGMLDHGLEVISIAAKLRQSYILPQNAIPEEQSKQRDVWTAVVIYAALLHDIGKCAVDIEVVLRDGSRWFPWQGIPKQPYNFRYIKGRNYDLHPALGGFFANLLIPKSAFDWIAPFPKAFSDLMYFVAGHTDKSGILSEIIQKADQISVTMALGGDPNKLAEKPQMSFAKQLLIALRQVIENYKFNTQQGGCDGWLTHDGLWVMSKSTADNIRAVLIKQGIAVPSQNGKLFDELQTHKLIDITSDGKAIWSCKVTSNQGWTHDKPFSLLRIPAHIVWESIDDRPTLFEGRVEFNGNVDSQGGNELLHMDVTSPPLTTQNNSEIDPNINQSVSIMEDIPQAESSGADFESPIVENVEMLSGIAIKHTSQPVENINTDTSLEFVLDMFPVSGIESINTESVNQTSVIIEPVIDAATINNETVAEQQRPQQKLKSEGSSKKARVTKTNVSKANTDIDISNEQYDTNPELDPLKFIDWIKAGIISGSLFVNRPNAVIHKVEDHLFLVTPSIFKIYLRDVVKRTDTASWELLQKRFQTLGIHRRQHLEGDSRNIWKCSVIGPNKKSELSGFLIQDPKLLIGDKIFLNNQWLTLRGELK
ncbi:TraI domain-containing protein [Ursidibacter maritimus]|uniref:TraI domain-containing protein n=1 Tax=Ursidibacter maritimus TaxID=1331689 RepID=A0A949SY75_9PAST|nr:MobH family relaxase [Ursidibacter maritimus]KAE9541380.1 hypothetical protein A1D26_00265 [Ursidibacter maritimus]MBV6524867.1 TraI domain-containing protein [Ursidibacter maritimus]MBV6526085.1 TraI domain-containing protein [Ursidibacter maritimus]MBV6527125.1 TraI domain-containing protein [Ursidibacter maritimus]MBV6529040.1 TraI domain-containing protein [Ursidibacter maritimus]